MASNLSRLLTTAGKWFSATQASVTGTAAIATGLGAIETGSAQATVANSALVLPTDTASIHAVAGGSVTVVVTNHAAAANSIETASVDVDVTCTGWAA